jgi:hypothetical protein
MVDFVKIAIRDGHFIKNSKLLDFKVLVSSKTGELENKLTAKHKGLKFYLYDSGRLIIQGSLHKYKNNGYNYNDFTLNELINDPFMPFY